MDYDILFFFPHRSAFFLFCADFRPKVKSEHPGLTIGDTAKKLGEMWNSSSAENKQPYERKAAKLKEKYDKVNKQFVFGKSENQVFLTLKHVNVCCFLHRISLPTARKAQWILDLLLQQRMMKRKRKKRRETRRKMTTMMRMTSRLHRDGTRSFVYAI